MGFGGCGFVVGRFDGEVDGLIAEVGGDAGEVGLPICADGDRAAVTGEVENDGALPSLAFLRLYEPSTPKNVIHRAGCRPVCVTLRLFQFCRNFRAPHVGYLYRNSGISLTTDSGVACAQRGAIAQGLPVLSARPHHSDQSTYIRSFLKFHTAGTVPSFFVRLLTHRRQISLVRPPFDSLSRAWHLLF